MQPEYTAMKALVLAVACVMVYEPLSLDARFHATDISTLEPPVPAVDLLISVKPLGSVTVVGVGVPNTAMVRIRISPSRMPVGAVTTVLLCEA